MPRLMLVSLFVLLVSISASCKPAPVENVYRKEGRFPDGVNAPVAPLAVEWAGKMRTMGSAWLIEGSRGKLFTATHVVDGFFRRQVSMGGRECKIFLDGRAYDCVVDRRAPLSDAAVLRIVSQYELAELPRPYKIALEEAKVGDEVFIMGFHPHPREITEANERDGFSDRTVPIFRTFYEQRFGNRCSASEVVFDVLKAKVVGINEPVDFGEEERKKDPLGELKYSVNMYFSVETERNHKVSFAGLSGGMAVRLDKESESWEVVGLITAENPLELEYDESGALISPCGKSGVIADTLWVTPIAAVMDLVEYARQIR